MKKKKGIPLLIAVMLVVGMGLSDPQQAEACGGQTASLGNVDGKLIAWTHEDGNPRAMDYRANVKPEEAYITPALAEAIAQKYVSKYYPNAEDMDFHAFLYEHGRYAYMYDITDASIKNTSSVTACGYNPQTSESNSEDIHIDAITGDVWDGQGCGGGASRIVMKYRASDYPASLNSQTVNLNQFHSDFVIPIAGKAVASNSHKDDHTDEHSQVVSNEPIEIDGRVGKSEWNGAAHKRLEQYGKTIDMRAKIAEGVLYWSIEADTKNWLALLLKTSPHHGMVWEFTDAKMLSENGVEDYHVAYKGMMVGAGLERDVASTVIAQASSETETGRIYEFSMPIQSGREGVDLQIGEYGNMAFYFGTSSAFSGELASDDAFSKQMVMHVGEEIHRGVLAKIIPTAVAAAFGGVESHSSDKALASGGGINTYALFAAIGVVLVAIYLRGRKRFKSKEENHV